MILGLHGKMGAGKSEAARRLALLSALLVVEVSFAAKLKESCAALLRCTVAELELLKNEPTATVRLETLYRADAPAADVKFFPGREQSIRSFLQRYGTEAHRNIFGQDFWLDAALPHRSCGDCGWTGRGCPTSHGCRREPGSTYDDALYVATDVRFENEAGRIRELGGRIVRLIGPNEHTGGHASEQILADVDFTVDNRERHDEHTLLDWQLNEILIHLGLETRLA